MAVLMNWRDHAACRGADPDLFFPVGTADSARLRVREAKQVCRACPVRARCLSWAVNAGVTDGVWGGTTEDERRVIRSALRKQRADSAAGASRGH